MRRRGLNGLRTFSACLVGLGLTFGVLPSCDRPLRGAARATTTDASTALTNPSRSSVLLADGRSIADVAAKVTPSVVNVFSERAKARNVEPGQLPFFSDPFFRFFFDQPGQMLPESPERREQSLGSGVVVSADGVIVTNNHVVAQAEKIRVSLTDGREFQAKLVGSDPKSDVAVLRVDARDLPAIPVADSSKTRVGDLVLAVGNPFGIGQTVTMGIISAVGRANMGITDYEDFIQTDAAINPGNSGGALVTMDGTLVGINTAIVSRTGGYQGIGFAIPSNMAMQVKDSILRHGKVVRGWLGVAIQDITEELAKSMGIAARAGVLVSDVTLAGPAGKAGLERGDVITAIDGVKTNDSAQLRNLVAIAGKGKKVRVEVLRGGKAMSFEVTLGELPAEGGEFGSGATQTQDAGLFAGVSVRNLDAATRGQMRIPANIRGVLVARVDPQSPAAGMGLRAGDVILEVNRTETSSVDTFRKAARQSEGRALVLVYRNGVTIFLSLSK